MTVSGKMQDLAKPSVREIQFRHFTLMNTLGSSGDRCSKSIGSYVWHATHQMPKALDPLDDLPGQRFTAGTFQIGIIVKNRLAGLAGPGPHPPYSAIGLQERFWSIPQFIMDDDATMTMQIDTF